MDRSSPILKPCETILMKNLFTDLLPLLHRHMGDTAVVSTVTSQQEGPGFDSGSGCFCVEFVCSPCVFLGSLGSPGSPGSSHCPNISILVVGRLIGHSELLVGVNVNVDGCLSLYVSCAMN